jgi:transcription elongation factor Elf1
MSSDSQEATQEFQPKCPTCGSPNVEKISVANKAKNALLWGVFSLGRLSKTFHCKQCKYVW